MTHGFLGYPLVHFAGGGRRLSRARQRPRWLENAQAKMRPFRLLLWQFIRFADGDVGAPGGAPGFPGAPTSSLA